MRVQGRGVAGQGCGAGRHQPDGAAHQGGLRAAQEGGGALAAVRVLCCCRVAVSTAGSGWNAGVPAANSLIRAPGLLCRLRTYHCSDRSAFVSTSVPDALKAGDAAAAEEAGGRGRGVEHDTAQAEPPGDSAQDCEGMPPTSARGPARPGDPALTARDRRAGGAFCGSDHLLLCGVHSHGRARTGGPLHQPAPAPPRRRQRRKVLLRVTRSQLT